MKLLSFLLTPALALGTVGAMAQFQGRVYEEDSSVVVSAYSNTKKLAWCGGFNNPQFNLADLNKDGLQDLVIFQSDQGSIKTFINQGTAGSPDYRYAPKYADNFPEVYDYMVLKDFNKDNIPDLFHWGGTGISVSRGYYNSLGMLQFSFYKELYYNNNSKLHGSWINAEVNPGDIPAIVDVDNDGDLDFLSYYGDGYYMNWYQNMQQELGLPDDSIRIRLADQCWGKMVQYTLRTHRLGIYCDNSNLMKKADPGSTAKVTDGGNTPCLIDMDGDGDYDLLDGHRAFEYMVYLRNGKDGGPRDSMVYQDTTWVSMGDTVKIATWPAGFHCDIDQDGARDLLIAPNAGTGSENYRCIAFYKNVGTDAVPSFKLQSDTFLIDQTIDLGTGSYPFFYDYNKDGKPDLFVGCRGYYDKKSGQNLARISYYENTSSSGSPSFNLITDDFLSLGDRQYKGISIGIGDINNDGKDDLLMGHIDGSVDVIRNTAGSGMVQPVWTSAPVALRDAAGDAIKTNGSSVPLVYDMNKDGKTDLVIGDQTGYLYYYQASGSSVPGTESLILTNNMLGMVKSDPEKLSTGNSTPFIGKMDNSGIEYLVMGSRSGRIFRFTGFQTGLVTMGYPRLDSAYSFILSDKHAYTSYLSAPAIADIDGDGNYEMLVGNVYGGLLLFRQMKTVSVPESPVLSSPKLRLYPNPAQQDLYLALEQVPELRQARVNIYNSMGQLVLQQDHFTDPRNLKVAIGTLAPAVYLCVLQYEGGSYNAVFVKRN